MGAEGRKNIAVLIANMDCEYANEILRGIRSKGRTLGYNLIIFNAYGNKDNRYSHNVGEYNIYTLPNWKKFDGIILLTNSIQSDEIMEQVVRESKISCIPMVSIDSEVEGAYFVGVDNYNAMKKMVEHFIEHHHFTHINYLSGLQFNRDSSLRKQAFLDTMKAHNLSIEDERIYSGSFTYQDGLDAVKKFSESVLEFPEVIICANDSMALGVYQALRDRGIAIPQDVAVSGFDNVFNARNAYPKISTVDRSLYMAGQVACDKIAQMLLGELPTDDTEQLLDTTCVFSESCGCADEFSIKNIRNLRMKYLHDSQHYGTYLGLLNYMTEKLNASQSFEDFLERLKEYVDIFECDKFYLCLCDNWNSKDSVGMVKIGSSEERYMIHGYTPNITVPLAYENHHYVKMKDFSSELMIPDMYEPSEWNKEYVFEPLHFQDRCFGYLVIVNSDFVQTSHLFHSMVMSIGNALENIRKQEQLQRTLRILDQMYVEDSLTKLYNRFGFTRFSEELFSKCIEKKSPIMMLFADMDGLKQVNDHYGHKKGDIALCTIAKILDSLCLGKEVCARFGGDEFLVFAPDYDENKAEEFCRNFESKIMEYNENSNMPFKVSASYGYYIAYPGENDDIEQYINNADEYMYRRKKQKKAMSTIDK